MSSRKTMKASTKMFDILHRLHQTTPFFVKLFYNKLHKNCRNYARQICLVFIETMEKRQYCSNKVHLLKFVPIRIRPPSRKYIYDKKKQVFKVLVRRSYPRPHRPPPPVDSTLDHSATASFTLQACQSSLLTTTE